MICAESQPAIVPQTAVLATAELPWETALFGRVSLFEMLQVAASDFYIISSTLTQLIGYGGKLLTSREGWREYNEKMTLLLDHSTRLKMKATFNQIGYMKDYFDRGGNSASELSAMLTELHKRVHEDLDANIFLVVSIDKASFFDIDWLRNTAIFDAFPAAVFPEMQNAGRCYAFGQNEACMFHLMRVVDYGLRLVAASLASQYDARNWVGIGDAIQKKMEAKYNTKTSDWKQSEPFYASILTDIQAISRGHRNPVVHELEKKYDDKEAHYMLVVTEAFMSHLAKHGLKE